MERIVVVGASGLARVVVDIVEKAGRHTIAGVIDAKLAAGTEFFGYPVLGKDEDLPALMVEHDVRAAVVAIGDNWTRRLVMQRLARSAPVLDFPAVLHPSVQVARGVSIGRGAIAPAGVVLSAGTRIGESVFLAINSSVGHDNEIGDFAMLGPAAATAGDVRIGACSVLGMGACVIQGVSIGAHTVIGAGATVVSDIGDHVVAFGTPAAVVRTRRPDDGYL
jgi:sugar O-acyltransferase (sialic acid O-acetyltransferase NeuD family)